MKRIYLIDCPGVVPPNVNDNETDIILKGSVRIENVSQPEDSIPTVLERVRPEYIRRTYGLREWKDPNDFLEQLARKTGKILKRGEPDIHNVSVMVLHDWLRGRIPFYVPPPESVAPKTEDQLEMEDIKKKLKVGVDQIFGKIAVSADFMKEDLENNAELIAKEKEMAKQKKEQEEEKKKFTKNDDDNNKSEMNDVTDWDEVFESVVGEEGPKVHAPVIEGEEVDSELEISDMEDNEDDDDVEEDVEEKEDNEVEEKDNDDDMEEQPSSKKAKTSTSTEKKKKIGTHFYETANVKNRNRNKVKPDDATKKVLHSRLKGSESAGKRKRR